MTYLTPGSTIGLIGSSQASALLAQAYGRLGYRVASLVQNEMNPVRQFSSWQTTVDQYDDAALISFAQHVDLVISEMGLITFRQYQLLTQFAHVAMNENLLAITTDRLIEKNFLDQHRCLIAPFTLVTNQADIEEAVEYLGFPCILKSTQRHVHQADDHVILYNEDDYAVASEKLANGSCILESWIPVERTVSLTVVRNERGNLLVYPVFEVLNDPVSGINHVAYPAQIDPAVAQEIQRIGQRMAQALALTGTMTLRFFVTSAGVIYVNEMRVGLREEALFTLGSMSLSHYDATARGMLNLPLPELRIRAKAALAIPIESLDRESVLTQFRLRTDWGFVFFSPMGADVDYLTGYVIITGDSLEGCRRQLDITELNK